MASVLVELKLRPASFPPATVVFLSYLQPIMGGREEGDKQKAGNSLTFLLHLIYEFRELQKSFGERFGSDNRSWHG